MRQARGERWRRWLWLAPVALLEAERGSLAAAAGGWGVRRRAQCAARGEDRQAGAGAQAAGSAVAAASRDGAAAVAATRASSFTPTRPRPENSLQLARGRERGAEKRLSAPTQRKLRAAGLLPFVGSARKTRSALPAALFPAS